MANSLLRPSLNQGKTQSTKAATKNTNEYQEPFSDAVKRQRAEARREFKDMDSQKSFCNLEFQHPMLTKTNYSLCDSDKFSAIFQQAHQTIMLDGLAPGTATNGKDVIESHTMKATTDSAIRDAHRLCEELERFALKLSSHKPSTQLLYDKWSKEVQETERVIEIGRRVGENKVASLLAVPQAADVGPGSKQVTEMLFSTTNETAEETKWADLARKNGQMVKKLTAALPRE